MSSASPKVLLVCGPAGVGKSTLSWEIGGQLQAANVAHAVLDSDELDRVWPITHADQERLSRENLAAFWANASALGMCHLVLVGVFLDADLNFGWIRAAIPEAEITRIVLDASDHELERRVRQREIGSGADAQLVRTLEAARLFRARHPEEGHVLHTNGRTVPELAAEAISVAGWTGPAPVVAAPRRRVEVSIREYRPDDHASCRELWAELTEHHRRIYADPSIGGDDPGAHFDVYLATPERVVSWVAELDGHVIGLTGLFDHESSGEVEPVVVSETYRGAGVGRALIGQVIEEATRRHYDYLAIRPVARNTAAIARFHAAGFRTLGGHVDLTVDLGSRRHRWLSYAHLHGLDFRY